MIRRLLLALRDSSVDRFLVHQDVQPGPATHAIVVGVGDYPHLLQGSGTLNPNNDGMGQLSSPPISARAFAEWLIKSYSNDPKKLQSVALLLSESPTREFVNPKTGKQLTPERATYDNVATAIQAWAKRGAENPDNILIFYFCGHGVSQGTDMTLLMSDYGKNVMAPLEDALDFRKFRRAMQRNLPGQQLYFIDACRSSTDTLIQALDYTGRVPVQLGQQPPAVTPIYYATLSGEDAFGKKDEVSFFTNALLTGLNGTGSDNPKGQWFVTTTRLKEAIDFEIQRAFEGGAKRRQVPPTDELHTFVIHRLSSQPEVPVFVTCDPEANNKNAEFVCNQKGEVKNRRAPDDGVWTLKLPAGEYEFSATLPGGVFQPKDSPVRIRPIYIEVSIEVSP